MTMLLNIFIFVKEIVILEDVYCKNNHENKFCFTLSIKFMRGLCIFYYFL